MRGTDSAIDCRRNSSCRAVAGLLLLLLGVLALLLLLVLTQSSVSHLL
jgi:hypothetical protein